MTDYRAPTGMPEDWGLYPKSVRPDIELPLTAWPVPHETFGFAVLVTDGSHKPTYIPKTRQQLIEFAAECLRLACT
jgi:hypothetical protein